MTPALRLAISLVASLLLWLPTVPGAIASHEDPARIALHYLLALVVSRFGVGMVFRIVNSYAPPESDDEADETLASGEADDPATEIPAPPGRRRDDLVTQPTSDEELLDDALDEVSETTAMVS